MEGITRDSKGQKGLSRDGREPILNRKKKQYEKNVRLLNMIISMCLGEGVEMRIWGVAPTQGDQVCFTAWTL